MLTRFDVDIPSLDDQGRGWVELDVRSDRVVSIVVNGSYPPVDGYWPIPQCGRQTRGGKTVIELTNGSPRGHVILSVWTLTEG